MINPPQFWQREDGAKHPFAQILRPIASIYDAIGRSRIRKADPFVATGPVVCIGNVSMGGVGKTPFAIMLAGLLQASGRVPVFLTRGYGGSEKGPVLITEAHTATESGDEAQLLRQQAPVVKSVDRPAGARFAFAETKGDVLIMDDGFQNPSLKKNFSLLLVDAETGFGNGLVFPAGPLREKPDAAKARADAIVFVMPHEDFSMPESLIRFAEDKPVFRAWLETEALPEKGKKAVAFCGIGRPEKFYRSARKAGYDLCATEDFPDHYTFASNDLEELDNLAAMHDAVLLTTEKDYVRIEHGFRQYVETLPVRMRVDKEKDLIALFEENCRVAELTADMIYDPHDPARWDAAAELPARRSNVDVTIGHRAEAAVMGGLFGLFKVLGVDHASGFLGGVLKRLGR